MGAVDEIIADLKRIPKRIDTEINMKKVADEVSKILERKNRGRYS